MIYELSSNDLNSFLDKDALSEPEEEETIRSYSSVHEQPQPPLSFFIGEEITKDNERKRARSKSMVSHLQPAEMESLFTTYRNRNRSKENTMIINVDDLSLENALMFVTAHIEVFLKLGSVYGLIVITGQGTAKIREELKKILKDDAIRCDYWKDSNGNVNEDRLLLTLDE